MERAIRDEFSNRPISILRPPMILGPRDTATLPLFRMARGAIRIKPGLRTKSYSFIAVEDLVAAIFLALESEPFANVSYVASAQSSLTENLMLSIDQLLRQLGLPGMEGQSSRPK